MTCFSNSIVGCEESKLWNYQTKLFLHFQWSIRRTIVYGALGNKKNSQKLVGPPPTWLDNIIIWNTHLQKWRSLDGTWSTSSFHSQLNNKNLSPNPLQETCEQQRGYVSSCGPHSMKAKDTVLNTNERTAEAEQTTPMFPSQTNRRLTNNRNDRGCRTRQCKRSEGTEKYYCSGQKCCIRKDAVWIFLTQMGKIQVQRRWTWSNLSHYTWKFQVFGSSKIY